MEDLTRKSLGLDEAFEIVLTEFRNRIVPKVFAVDGEEPSYEQVPINNRCDMFMRYLKHLEDNGLINYQQCLALEIKYLDEVFSVTKDTKDGN